MITLRDSRPTLGVSRIPTGPNKTGGVHRVYIDVASEVLDHTDVRGKIEPLAFRRHGGVTLVKGVPR
jgi:hypothetical protein